MAREHKGLFNLAIHCCRTAAELVRTFVVFDFTSKVRAHDFFDAQRLGLGAKRRVWIYETLAARRGRDCSHPRRRVRTIMGRRNDITTEQNRLGWHNCLIEFL